MLDLATASDEALIDYHLSTLDGPAPPRLVAVPPKNIILPSSKIWTPDTLLQGAQKLRTVKVAANDTGASLSYSQHRFLTLPQKYRAYVGGFGSGKTFVGCLDLLTFALRHPGTVQGYFAPTFGLIRDIFYGTIAEAAELLGLTVDIKEGNKEVHIFNGRRYIGTVICRTMDNPNNIIGFKIARALVDEIDTLPTEKALQAWNKIIARMRIVIPGVVNGIGLTTTPEGFKFVYEAFHKTPQTERERIKRAHYGMVQSTTYENLQYLPDDYIETLLASYPIELVRAYLLGMFVNLRSGTVYSSFDRQLNRSDKTLDKSLALAIGCDFNVTNCSATVLQMHGDNLHAVEELHGLHNTQALASKIVSRYGEHWGGRITMFPDASGSSRKTSSNTTDHQILREAGLAVITNPTNPAIVDRVNCMNNAFCDYRGQRTLFVSPQCVKLTHGLEAQTYDLNGKPEKQSGVDHLLDSCGYALQKLRPLQFRHIINANQTTEH